MTTHSASKRGLKPTNIGPSTRTISFMVRIDWTSRQVIKFTATKDFNLVGKLVGQDRKVVGDYQVFVATGKTLYLVASESLDGWYYLSDGDGCSCPGAKRWHHCRHLEAISTYNAQQMSAEDAREKAARLHECRMQLHQRRIEREQQSMPVAPLTAEEWKQAMKRNKKWQREQKAADLARLAEVKAASVA